MVTSELSILMAKNHIRRLNYLQEQTNLSWDIFNKLINDDNITTIRLGNIVKICNILRCNVEDLVNIKYPYKPIDLVNKTHGPSNLKLLMSINDIDTINELGGYVYIFVVDREVATKQLGIVIAEETVFQNDPIGWAIIILASVGTLYLGMRLVFFRKKVRVLK